MMREALSLTPEYRDYVWGGDRLRPSQSTTAEAWIIYERDLITNGPLAGRSLAEAAAEYGEKLLGQRVVARTGLRFPLLIKLLDCAEWLSLQVHPNDEQAVRLEGPGHFGKTEAWHIVEAEPGAELLCGLRPGVSAGELETAVRGGTILDLAQRLTVRTGDSLFIPPGLMHALGPGLLIYEVQQTSDITYRVFDWNRPVTSGRKLHIEQSLAVVNRTVACNIVPPPEFENGGQHRLVSCPYFTMELLTGETNSLSLDTSGKTFHALTVLEGQAQVEGYGWTLALSRFESALIPAACGAYHLQPLGPFRALKASVE
jgi:mannose-6-phosphate isomerase